MSYREKDVDFDNLSGDERAYFDQRPWLKEEYERHTGNPFPEEGESSDPESDEDEDEVDYSTWSPDDLKAEVETRELEVTGTGKDGNVLKADMVAALEADDAEEEDENE